MPLAGAEQLLESGVGAAPAQPDEYSHRGVERSADTLTAWIVMRLNDETFDHLLSTSWSERLC
jgi:hypothetical protein